MFQAELNLSDVVKQILQTSRGTEFYLLPDAGLTSAESVEGQDEDNLQTEDKTNDAIINMIIPKSLILQTKLKLVAIHLISTAKLSQLHLVSSSFLPYPKRQQNDSLTL